MVLLSSTGYSSPNDFMVQPDDLPTEMGYDFSEDSEVDLHEFRQVVSLSASNSIVSNEFPVYHISQAIFSTVSFVQAHSFLQIISCSKPSPKLFLDHNILVL